MSETKIPAEPAAPRGYGLKVASATVAAIAAAVMFSASENMQLGHAERWQDGAIVAGALAVVLAGMASKRTPSRRPEPRASVLRAGIEAASRFVEARKANHGEAPDKTATPNVNPLEIERERRRTEKNEIPSKPGGGGDTGKTSFGAGMPMPTGFLHNLHSTVAIIREFVPSFKSNLTDVLDSDAGAATRISGAVSIGVKTVAAGVVAYFVFLEGLQLRSAAYKTWAEACIQRQQNAVNFSTVRDLELGTGPERELEKECAGR